MIQSFGDRATEDLYHQRNTSRARRIPADIWSAALRKLDLVNSAADLQDLRVLPGNRLEALKGDLQGYHSIRVNDQWRVVFRWQNGQAMDVEIVDYH